MSIQFHLSQLNYIFNIRLSGIVSFSHCALEFPGLYKKIKEDKNKNENKYIIIWKHDGEIDEEYIDV